MLSSAHKPACKSKEFGLFKVDFFILPTLHSRLYLLSRTIERVSDTLFHAWRCDKSFDHSFVRIYGEDLAYLVQKTTNGRHWPENVHET